MKFSNFLALKTQNHQKKIEAIQTLTDKLSKKVAKLEKLETLYGEIAAIYSIRHNLEKNDNRMALIHLKMKKLNENHACLISTWRLFYRQIIAVLEDEVEALLNMKVEQNWIHLKEWVNLLPKQQQQIENL